MNNLTKRNFPKQITGFVSLLLYAFEKFSKRAHYIQYPHSVDEHIKASNERAVLLARRFLGQNPNLPIMHFQKLFYCANQDETVILDKKYLEMIKERGPDYEYEYFKKWVLFIEKVKQYNFQYITVNSSELTAEIDELKKILGIKRDDYVEMFQYIDINSITEEKIENCNKKTNPVSLESVMNAYKGFRAVPVKQTDVLNKKSYIDSEYEKQKIKSYGVDSSEEKEIREGNESILKEIEKKAEEMFGPDVEEVGVPALDEIKIVEKTIEEPIQKSTKPQVLANGQVPMFEEPAHIFEQINAKILREMDLIIQKQASRTIDV